MSFLFDLERFRTLLEDFNRITGLNACAGASDAGPLVIPEMSPICKIIRSCPAGEQACRRCDREAVERAIQRKGVYIYRCHAGLTEAAVPVFFRDAMIANLSFGMLLSYRSHEEGWNAVRQWCSQLPLDQEALKKACFDSPLIPKEQIVSAANVLSALASHVVLEKMFQENATSTASLLDGYLRAHYAEPLTVPQLCSTLQLGKNQVFSLCQELYGHGPARQIKLLRLEQAKQLLTEQPELSIREVAFASGFTDYNYFIRIFSQEVGQPPKAYRMQATSMGPM